MASEAELLDGLNEALAYEYQAIIMYNTYAATVSGIHRGELKEFFGSEIQDEQGHAHLLAEKIDALGGNPATDPKPVTVPGEPRKMLEVVLESETDAVHRYTELSDLAEDAGQPGLANDLDDFVSDETTHMEETQKLLRGKWA